MDCDEPLATLDRLIPWEQFRPALMQALDQERRKVVEHRLFDSVPLFKAAVLKRLYGLTAAQTACQIADRRSFQRFLGLAAGGRTENFDPRAFSICLASFLEILHWRGIACLLFDRVNDILDETGVRIKSRQVLDIEVIARI